VTKIIFSIFLLIALSCGTQEGAQREALKSGYKVLYSVNQMKTLVEDSSGNVILLLHADLNNSITEKIMLKKYPCSSINTPVNLVRL
jgi:hypothetical protein